MEDNATEANEEIRKLSGKYPDMIFLCAPKKMTMEEFVRLQYG